MQFIVVLVTSVVFVSNELWSSIPSAPAILDVSWENNPNSNIVFGFDSSSSYELVSLSKPPS